MSPRLTTWQRIARSLFPKPATITGDGPFAVYSPCFDDPTVHLYLTKPEAVREFDRIRPACGDGDLCWPSRHQLVDLREPDHRIRHSFD